MTFLYIGLASVSITINLLIANITLQYRRHKEKIKIVQKLEQELDDSDNDESGVNGDNRVASRRKRNNSDVTEMSNLEQDRKKQQSNNINSSTQIQVAKDKNVFESLPKQQEEPKSNYKDERKYIGL